MNNITMWVSKYPRRGLLELELDEDTLQDNQLIWVRGLFSRPYKKGVEIHLDRDAALEDLYRRAEKLLKSRQRAVVRAENLIARLHETGGHV